VININQDVKGTYMGDFASEGIFSASIKLFWKMKKEEVLETRKRNDFLLCSFSQKTEYFLRNYFLK